MTSLGPLTLPARPLVAARAGHRRSGRREPGSVDDYLSGRRQLGLRDGSLHGAGSGGVLCEDRRNDAVGEHPAAPEARTMHERWETLADADSIRDAEGVRRSAPRCRSTARSPAAGRRRRPRRGRLARGRARHGFLPRRQGRASEDPLSRPHAGERQGHTEGAARGEVAHTGSCAPNRRYRRRRRRQLDLPGDPVAHPRSERLLAW